MRKAADKPLVAVTDGSIQGGGDPATEPFQVYLRREGRVDPAAFSAVAGSARAHRGAGEAVGEIALAAEDA